MNSRNIDRYINRYSLSKTLRFQLLPIGKTEESFEKKQLLKEDDKRSADYKAMKKIFDDYHKHYINSKLAEIKEIDISNYADLYYKANKDLKDKKAMKQLEESLRKTITDALTKDDIYAKLFKKEFFSEVLLEYFDENQSKKQLITEFINWTTYFQGFFENRNNLYTAEEKSTAIAYRCINDNLPKFLDNCAVYRIIKEALPQSDLETIDDEYYSLSGVHLDEVFDIAYFCHVLSQNGIDKYNNIIGGYTNSDQTLAKFKGLNEIINLHNQKSDRKNRRLPKFKMLFKQILSDRNSISFIPDSFDNDNEVLKSINDGYNELMFYLDQLYKTFESLDSYDQNGIYIKREYLSAISQKITDDWSTVTNKWNNEYDDNHLNVSKPPKDMEKYYDKRKTAYSQIESFSIYEIQRLIGDAGSVTEYYSSYTLKLIDDIRIKYKDAEQLLINEYIYDKKLAKNDSAIDKIKALLDIIKELERTIKQLMGTGKEDNKNDVFYGDVQPAYESLREFDRLYDKVRNYITKKPYSKDKIKLNFQNPQFLNGWDRNKETDYRSTLLKNGDNYYLAVMDREYNKVFESYPSDDSSGWQKINYKLLPGPNKMLPKVFFAKSNIDYFAPSSEILEIRAKKTYKTNKGDCEKLIDFYKEALEKHEDWRDFGFSFKDTKSYKDLDEFYNDIKVQGYKISYSKISEKYLMDLVDEGKIYLFKIYNKDFSEYSKGTPNLHTLYFKMIFDERNLKDVVYKLSGGAEMFYRFPSLKLEETTVHHAGDIVKNKNQSNPGEKKLKYDIIKDKRFTRPQFSIHIPITMNFKSKGIKQCNYDVRYDLKYRTENYVIGIDRGERHLLYVTVINSKGEIVEQYSLNEIINDYNGANYSTNYHQLLDKKEKERDQARKNWTTIEGIRELKEGYVSQAVHKICKLVVKYDAIIAMEDLNMGFKQSRIKVEKQVYQKFEKMLIDKLNYLIVDKNMDPEENGGLLKAYQLTEKFTSFINMGKQNGFIFYVPPYLTSKIDPVTGFVDMLRPKYESKEMTQAMISNFDFVRYNAADDMFEFGIDYSKVERGSTSFVKKWIVCTNGERILTFRNKDKNSEWDNETIILSKAFKDLFERFDVSYTDNSDIKTQLLEKNNAEFYKEFSKLLSLTLQIRNSITGSDTDYLISPVRDKNGKFFNSDDFGDMSNAPLPKNADANGAYNIARKALWCIEQIKATEDDKLDKVKLAISNKEWLEYAQKG